MYCIIHFISPLLSLDSPGAGGPLIPTNIKEPKEGKGNPIPVY